MVSFWPWRGDANSAESFEKQLSSIATKITKATHQNDSLRQRSRMLKVGWILWGGISYIITSAVLFWTHGWRNWGAVEIAIVVGGPILLYAVRSLLNAWYSYRTTNSQEYLDNLYRERDATIEKLKQATKYDSTQQLLEKYGSAPKKQTIPSKSPQRGTRKVSGRVQLPIPPTANIQRKPVQIPSQQSSPPQSTSHPQDANQAPQSSVQKQEALAGEDFAPNAFDPLPQFASSTQRHVESHWYDRIFDALLGEDEALAKNRLALICKRCRIVNGLAPPGVKTLEQLGKWRCSGCGTWNGEEDEAARLVQEASKTGTTGVQVPGRDRDDKEVTENLRERKSRGNADEDGEDARSAPEESTKSM